MGNSSEREAEATTEIAPSTLEAYFKSIEEPFRETRRGLAGADSPIGIFVFCFVFSLIPVIPYLLSKITFSLFGPRIIGVRTFHFHLASFWFWWIASFVLSLSLLVIVGKFLGPSAEEKKRWLSPQQMRFAYCYAAVDEIRKYRTNQRSAHIEAALDDVSKIGTSLMRASTLDLAASVYPDQYWQKEIQISEAQAAEFRSLVLRADRPKWYRLQPETELILQACRGFTEKLRDRVKDRKDLATIEALLTDLARYLYTEIPELSDSKSQPGFEQTGMESLLSFARQINELPAYRSEPLNQTPRERASEKILSGLNSLSGLLSHQNTFVCFFAWYVLTLLLFCGGFYLAFRYVPTLKMDSTIIATIVGGPIATAVTAVTIPRLAKARK